MRLVSWNVLRRVGATPEVIAALIDVQRPDLLLLQEAVADIDRLQKLIGGYYWRQSMPNRVHGLAIWSPAPFPAPTVLELPYDPKSRSGDRRIAAVLSLDEMSVANIHLTHGQRLLRRQLRHIADNVVGPLAIAGDTNAVGPTLLKGFRDVGPRRHTHLTKGILPVRLDRCLVRGIACTLATALDRGRSDHRPILVDLESERVDAARH